MYVFLFLVKEILNEERKGDQRSLSFKQNKWLTSQVPLVTLVLGGKSHMAAGTAHAKKYRLPGQKPGINSGSSAY